MSTGTKLEGLIRRSAKKQGLRLRQTGPRAIGTGEVDADGRPISVHVESGFLDFVLQWPGGHAEFDAKSTKLKSLPLRNLKRNQVTTLRRTVEAGGIAFFLVEFSDLPDGPEYFALDWRTLAVYWPNTSTGKGPQSIPLSVFRSRCQRITHSRAGLDLMDVINRLHGAVA
jgi:penicillin-binding protein-related factor A (putative recombinase)